MTIVMRFTKHCELRRESTVNTKRQFLPKLDNFRKRSEAMQVQQIAECPYSKALLMMQRQV